MRHLVWVCCLLLCGCASTQLTSNVLDVASSTSQLSREQVLHNLAQFIDNPAAIPAQVVFGQGSVSTTNTVSATFTDPLSKTVAITDSAVRAAVSSVTSTTVETTSNQSLGVTGGNTALQSWGVDTIGDPDQLRRLYDLYRFAVDGNNCPHAQLSLLLDYPLPYSPTSSTGSGGNNTKGNGADASAVRIDPYGLIGSNCVLCAETSASAPSSPDHLKVCEGENGSQSIFKVRAAANPSGGGVCGGGGDYVLPPSGRTVHRVELKGLGKQMAGGKTTSGASLVQNSAGKVCLALNRRLLPRENLGRWLLWEALPGAKHPTSNPAPDHEKDIFLGFYGHYALYVDGTQPERFSEFVIFITAAAASTLNPATSGANNGFRQTAPSGVALTQGVR